jgi:glycosyltransferase involved in cell wall biosynthesis
MATSSIDGCSCLCLTYGRPALLEEAVESFLRQEGEVPRELIVVNDHPAQEIVCDAPGVHVFNLPRRLKTLGEKRNLSVALSRYKNLLIWDDDDIYLPWRVEAATNLLTENDGFRCPYAWVMNNDHLAPEIEHNFFHGCMGVNRALYEAAGGYPFMNGGEDAAFEKRLKNARLKYSDTVQLPADQLFYIYRWKHGHYHTTAVPDLEMIQPVIQPGRIVLVPHWSQDYVALTRRHRRCTGRYPSRFIV